MSQLQFVLCRKIYCRIPKKKQNNRFGPPKPYIWICYCYAGWLISRFMFIHRFTTHPDNLLQQLSVKTTPDVPTSVFPPARGASRAHARVGWWWRQMAGRVLLSLPPQRHLQVCVTALSTSTPPTGMCYSCTEWLLNASVWGRVSSSRKSFWTHPIV